MAEKVPQEAAGPSKGKAFFERAEQVAETGNWDFAIEMYIEGIKRDPGNLDRGHKPLRDVSMKRKAQGGKGPGMMDQVKHRAGRDPLTNLVNGSYMLAKDPGSVAFMEHVFHAARKLELNPVVNWIADILIEAQRHSKKPSKRVLLMVTEAFEAIGEYAKAVQACDMALSSNPDDGDVIQLARNLSAKYTIKAGKYDQEGDFTRSVKDMDKQQELMQKDSMVKDQRFLEQQVTEARQGYLESPTVAGKINAFIDAMLRMDDESYENEAIDVLAKAHRDTGAYQFKMRTGDIRIRQMVHTYRKLLADGDKAAAAEQAQRQLAFELDEYKERAANYPTDLAIMFELGRRQYLSGLYDEAIPTLQRAQRDPRRSVRALCLIGQAFAKKGLFREAADSLERALKSEMLEEQAKEVRYYLGDVLESMGERARAQEQFSIVAQIDYNYKDVRERLERLRKQQEA